MDVKSNIVVTGGAGFIGSHLVELLLAQGAHVTVIDDLSVGSQDNIQIENPSLSFVPCDIRSDTAKDIYADAEIVFHLAVKNVRASLPRPKENFDINATGTLEILEAMRNGARGKFVYFSSSEVYGNAVTSTFAETTVPHPTTIYAADLLDLIAEIEVHAMAHITGGGLAANTERVLPVSMQLTIDRATWELPPLFSYLQNVGGVPNEDLERTFNCGVGMVLLVPAKSVTATLARLRRQGHQAWELGEVAPSDGARSGVKLEGTFQNR